jgi:glycosyltransferase involved in cell wall biosynthesis
MNSAPRRLISLVLPVYDEEGNLEELYRQLNTVMRARPERYEMVFVDDGSTDRSMEILERLTREDMHVRVVQLRRNFGKAAAYSAGFFHSRGEIVITLDTDLQDDPAEIPMFIEAIDRGFDMVIGWKHEGKGPINKSLPSKLFNRVVTRITGIPLNDFNCPFKAYRREVLQEIDVYGELHRYIPVLAAARGFSLTEIKIKNLPRLSGKSKYGMARYWRGMLDLLTISFITRFAKRPMHLLGIGGLVTGALGAGVLALLVAGHAAYEIGLTIDSSWKIHERPAITLGVLLIVVGVQIFSIALLGELLVTKTGSGSGAGTDRGYSVKRILGNETPE